MHKNISIPIYYTASLVDNTIEYFSKSGFKLAENDNRRLKFIRGSLASNMWTFNPLKWKSETRIAFNECEIVIELDIDTTYQIPTYAEEKLWDSFIENYEQFLNNNEFNFISQNKGRLRLTIMNSLKHISWSISDGLIRGVLIALIGVVLAAFIAQFTGIDYVMPIGAVVGVVVAGVMPSLVKKINNEKKNNSM